MAAASPSQGAGLPARAGPAGGTVVVCDAGDPFAPLGREIAGTESVPCLMAFDRALALKPRFVLWVGSPRFFTDRVLVQAGLVLKAYPDCAALGIISGRTIEEARALWHRRNSAKGARLFAVNGEYPTAGIMRGRILGPGGAASGMTDLTPATLIETLRNADYLTFTGHGGGSYWRLAQGASFRTADVPPVPPLVVAAASCQGVRLASEAPIALAFTGQGAAAYAGFLFSPIEGYLPGEFDGLPFRHTWPGVTVGEVVQLQNRGAMQGIAALPFYLLLGDPRIALQPGLDWSPLSIETVRGIRTLSYGEAEAGFYPLRIRGGAQYRFFEIPGTASASDGDLFYNSRLQMMNSGADKLLLLFHAGGELKVSMRRDPPRAWRPKDSVLDSLDHTLLFLPGTGGSWLPLAAGCLALLWIVLRRKRKAYGPENFLPAAAVGLAMGAGHALYAWGRLSQATITSKPLGVGAVEIAGTVLLAGCGAVLLLGTGSPAGKAAGVAVANFTPLGAAVVTAAFLGYFNFVYARLNVGGDIYNYSMVWMALIGMACQVAVFLVLTRMLQNIGARSRRT
jgi:hypothetical protein